MARPHSTTPPQLGHHKSSGRAYVTVRGQRLYLGKYGSPEANEAYARFLTEWAAGDVQPPISSHATTVLTVAEAVERYWAHAKTYYPLGPNGRIESQLARIRNAFKHVLKLYGTQPITTFRALALASSFEDLT